MTFLFSIFLLNKIEIIKEMLNSVAFVREEDLELSFFKEGTKSMRKINES